MTPIQKHGAIVAAFGLLSSVLAAGAPAAAVDSGSVLTLDQAISLALEKNQDIKVEAYAPPIARANLLTALGEFDPVFSLGRSYSHSDTPTGISAPVSPTTLDIDNYSIGLTGVLPTGLIYTVGGQTENERGTFNNFAGDFVSFGGINLTQPLLRGFGFAANLVNIRVARANRSISEWQYRQTVIGTVTNVIVIYDQLVLAYKNLQIAQTYRDLGAKLLLQSQQRLKDGSGAQSDVITAEATVASREEAILEAQNTLRNTDGELRELLGEKWFPQGRSLLTVQASPVPIRTVDPAGDYQEALNRRPDYQAARLGITINRANSDAARNGLLPQVNLVGSYGYNGLGSTFAAARQMVATENFPSSSIGLNISIPITNSQARGKARAARLTLEQSEASLKNMEAQIALTITTDAGQIGTTRARVIADQKAYDLAVQALAGEERKLELGTSSTINVITDQTNLATVENSLASARYAESEAVAVYDQDLGMTLARNQITLAEDK
jgi:outer membrane protein TolC